MGIHRFAILLIRGQRICRANYARKRVNAFVSGGEDDCIADAAMIGFNKGGWVAGPDYLTTALYPPVERAVELFSLEG